MTHDDVYAKLLNYIWQYGSVHEDRTGVGTRALFGTRMEFDLREGFPLLTGKRVHWKSVVEELLWFMRGETNINTLNTTIWDEWADLNGECGPIYGYQWKSWPSYDGGQIDQLANVIDSLKNKPNSRRHIVCAWNVAQVPFMALPPCHLLFQFHVDGDKLDCQMYQRSCDMFLGVPYNIASYSLLTQIVAWMTGLTPRKFIWVGGDTHIYLNHEEQVREYLSRKARRSPYLVIAPDGARTLNNWKFSDFDLRDYNPHPTIKASIAV